MSRGFVLALAALTWACGEPQPPPAEVAATNAPVDDADIDTLGVVNLAQGDTLIDIRGFTAIENTVSFAGAGEAFAWEFYAERLRPVKLVVLRPIDKGRRYELVGESETVIPRQVGVNRFDLREPIPVQWRDRMGLIQPEEQAIPFRKVMNWKTLGTLKPFVRPFMSRDPFANYGWRYSVRVLYRRPAGN